MFSFRLSLTCLAVAFFISSCSNNDTDRPAGEPAPVDKTYVIFSPATGDLPVPNDILFGRETAADGTMSAGSDPTNPIITGIDYLDGNSVLAPIDISFSGSLDNTQVLDANSFVTISGNIIPNPNQNIFLLPLTYPGGDPLRPTQVSGTSVEVPTFADAANYQRAAASGDADTLAQLAVPSVRVELLSLDGGVDNTIRLSPLTPLQPETKYLIVITTLKDAKGNQVFPSTAYDYIKDPDSNLGNQGLDPVRAAITGWEQLASGYFSFMGQVYDAAGLPVYPPEADDIIFTLTFTTTAPDRVLKSVAAPETFFEKSLRTSYKQEAIYKLVTGIYNLNGDNSNQTNTTDGAINSTIAFLLSSPTLPDSRPNALYNAEIAAAISAGTSYSNLATNPNAAHIMQRAAAEAAISVHNSGDQAAGDKAPYVSIAAEAAGTVAALAQAAQEPVSTLFPVPAARTSSFYRVDAANEINAALVAPARVYQGQITLPLYQAPPGATDPTNLVTSTWQADTNIGTLLDIALANDMGSTPPSSMVTYRYPFPTKQAEQTVPLLAITPDSTTLANFGVTKPAAGWPVVIFVHGITGDRSTSLPMADALAFACIKQDLSGTTGAPCFATVAIDHPLHGVTPAGSRVPGLHSVNDPDFPPTANNGLSAPSTNLMERHFNYTADAAANPIPMDYAADSGSSGGLFINLKMFANSRDSMRQTVLDLLNLNASLTLMDVDGDGQTNDLDTSRVYLIGHSLGAMNGLTFLALNNDPAIQNSPFNTLPKITAASAFSPGGEVIRLLANSYAYGQVILPSLAAASDDLAQGTSGVETYFNVFQGVLDAADPINFVGALKDSDTGVLVSEIIGNATSPSDRVIPNAADTRWGENKGPLSMVTNSGFSIDNLPAPLAGSEPLIHETGAIKSAEVDAGSNPAILVTRYTEGSHNTPITGGNTDLDPLTSAAVFNEILQQTITFFAQEGAPLSGSLVSNADVVEP